MLIHQTYTALKNILGTQIPVFYFINQYQKGQDNTSYKVPALYIQMPDSNNISFWGNHLVGAKNTQIKLHFISHAPFKNHHTAAQEAAIQAHVLKLITLDRLLNGTVLKNNNNIPITEELILTNTQELQFANNCIISVLTYNTTIYSRHLQQ